jgi:hypothetical protein
LPVTYCRPDLVRTLGGAGGATVVSRHVRLLPRLEFLAGRE